MTPSPTPPSTTHHIPGVKVSPTEPAMIRALGEVVSMEPEDYGADVMWWIDGEEGSEGVLVGIQRKELSDLLSSARDGRLGQQVAQLGSTDLPILVLEGRPTYSADGRLTHAYQKHWTREQVNNLLLSVQVEGVKFIQVNHLNETVDTIRSIHTWTTKPRETSSLFRRPKPKGSQWGTRGNRDYQEWFLQSLPNTGPAKAKAIINEVGFPFKLIATRPELLAVPGVGKAWVDAVIELFDQEEGEGQ